LADCICCHDWCRTYRNTHSAFKSDKIS
jgi:hypothetical protein